MESLLLQNGADPIVRLFNPDLLVMSVQMVVCWHVNSSTEKSMIRLVVLRPSDCRKWLV
jgi:hypothetical protein